MFRRTAAGIVRHPVVDTLIIVAAFALLTHAWAFAWFFMFTWIQFGDSGPSGFDEVMTLVLGFAVMFALLGVATLVAGRFWRRRAGIAVAVICGGGLIYVILGAFLLW